MALLLCWAIYIAVSHVAVDIGVVPGVVFALGSFLVQLVYISLN